MRIAGFKFTPAEIDAVTERSAQAARDPSNAFASLFAAADKAAEATRGAAHDRAAKSQRSPASADHTSRREKAVASADGGAPPAKSDRAAAAGLAREAPLRDEESTKAAEPQAEARSADPRDTVDAADSTDVVDTMPEPAVCEPSHAELACPMSEPARIAERPVSTSTSSSTPQAQQPQAQPSGAGAAQAVADEAAAEEPVAKAIDPARQQPAKAAAPSDRALEPTKPVESQAVRAEPRAEAPQPSRPIDAALTAPVDESAAAQTAEGGEQESSDDPRRRHPHSAPTPQPPADPHAAPRMATQHVTVEIPSIQAASPDAAVEHRGPALTEAPEARPAPSQPAYVAEVAVASTVKTATAAAAIPIDASPGAVEVRPEAPAPASGMKADTPAATSPGHAGSPQGAASGDADTDRVADQAMRGLRGAIAQRGGSVTLRLHPAELGALRIQVEMNNGVVKAQFHASNEATRSLLQHQLQHLRQALESHGLTVDQLQVNHAAPAPGGAASQNEPESDDGRSRGSFERDRHGSAHDREGDEAREDRRDPRSFGQRLLDLVA